MDERQCRRILEVSEEATFDEITRAYHRMKEAYSDDQASFVVPFMEEFSAEARSEVLAEIELAYRVLWQNHEADQTWPLVTVPLENTELQHSHSLGGLRTIRESLGLTLTQLAARTYMRPEILSALEDERFDELPKAAVNVRGFLTAYLTEIGIPAEDIVPSYMARFQEAQKRS